MRLRGRLEAYGVGGVTATGRCKGVSGRGEGGGGAMLCGRFCDVVVTPCDLRSLEMVQMSIGPLLLLCLGSALEL